MNVHRFLIMQPIIALLLAYLLKARKGSHALALRLLEFYPHQSLVPVPINNDIGRALFRRG